MCGICGIFNRDGQSVDMNLLLHMNAAQEHRGPDDEDLFVSDNIGLAFRRLSILDVQNGRQPMSNEDNSILLVFNGEIYNDGELREDLRQRGHQFKSTMDGEVILHLYEDKGIRLLEDLRGMFAFSLLDLRKRELYLARDCFGIKPLYFSNTNQQFLFASEIKSILASRQVRPGVNMDALWKYLSFQYVPDPETMFQGIHALPPAHYMLVSERETKLQRYWTADFEPDENRSLSSFADEIASVLSESVRMHRHSDVPYGAFLSSGVDSSVIASLLQQHQEIDTFTVSFGGANSAMDESRFARETAHWLRTRHHELRVGARQCMEALPNIVFHQDQPVSDASTIGVYFLAQLARQHVTVVLSGEGADELFGGYPIYHEPKSLQLFERIPSGMRQELGKLARMLPYGMKGRGFLERGSLPLEQRFIGNAYVFRDDVKEDLLLSSIARQAQQGIFNVTDPLYERSQGHDDITRMQLLDINTWLPGDILMKADKMTMAHSLELRVPFLDRKVFEVAASIPAKYRIAEGTTKYALRKAVAAWVPEAVHSRPKLGFPIPIRDWIKGEMHEFVQDTLRSGHMNFFFNKAFVDELLSNHMAGIRDNSRQIWTLLIFALWHQTYIERFSSTCLSCDSASSTTRNIG